MKKKKREEKVFIYWDNSNIFHEAQRFFSFRHPRSDVRNRVRIHFKNLYRLAHADRKVVCAYVAGSVPPDMESLWEQIQKQPGIEVAVIDRFARTHSEQDIPDRILQLHMLENVMDFDPGIAVVLTGDGAGYDEGRGFRRTLERMKKKGWGIELLSWKHSCDQKMKEWAEKKGIFVALDDFAEQITFVTEVVDSRRASALELSKRPRV
ncbi:MAG: NYN domain-containing protein [Gammaproteobacteria bacterium]|nr:NYN domain-containing protein [Gammaproteobacteria bacterium]